MFDDRNMHKYFTVLNFAIICIKPFICNNTIFSVSFLNEILLLHVFLNTTITDLYLKLDRILTDWLCKYSCDIPSQMHPSPITLWRIILIFKLLYIATSKVHFIIYRLQIIIRIWLPFQGCLIRKIFPFWFLNPLEYLPVLFSSRLLLWLALLAFTFPPAANYCSTNRGAVAYSFCIFKSSVLVSCRNSVF